MITECGARAPTIQADLLEYQRISRLDDGAALHGFEAASADTATLRVEVERAIRETVGQPVELVLEAFVTAAPWVAMLADGMAGVVGAVHDKVDAVTGEEGIGGMFDAIEEAVGLLRDLDLTPVTDPLDAQWVRIEGAVDTIDTAPLEVSLLAARDAIVDLIDLSNLIEPADAQELDEAYETAVDKLERLAPSRLIGEPLDAEYEELLQTILPVLDLPTRLREALRDAGADLGGELTEELARIEAAFEAMLRAIPLEAGGGSASASAGAAVG